MQPWTRKLGLRVPLSLELHEAVALGGLSPDLQHQHHRDLVRNADSRTPSRTPQIRNPEAGKWPLVCSHETFRVSDADSSLRCSIVKTRGFANCRVLHPYLMAVSWGGGRGRGVHRERDGDFVAHSCSSANTEIHISVPFPRLAPEGPGQQRAMDGGRSLRSIIHGN